MSSDGSDMIQTRWNGRPPIQNVGCNRASPTGAAFGRDAGRLRSAERELGTLKTTGHMVKEFIERRNGSFYLIGSRVPLAHIVREFQNGEPPEAIRVHYPTLTLEQVYGAITFYLGNKEEVEKDIAAREREEDEFTRTHPTPPEITEKFERMRQQMLARKG
jgi:uncharacterized protein (DUF433 family)